MEGQKDGRKDGRDDGWKDGGKDGQTLFHRTLSATAGGSVKHNFSSNFLCF